MHLEDIFVFVVLAQERSLSAVARRLNISAPSVSKKLARLESDLRAQLVVRTSRSISLTPAGEILFQDCSGFFPIIEASTQKIQDIYSNPGGRLRILATGGIGINLLAPRIALFQAQFPGIAVELTIRGLGSLLTGNPDLIFGSTEPPQKMYARQDIGVSHYVICASPGYLAAHPKILRPADLSAHNCLLYIDERENRTTDKWPFVTDGKPADVPVRGDFSSNDGAALCKLALAGQGIALLPLYVVYDEIKAGRLRTVLRKEINFSRTIRAFYPRAAHVPLNVRNFLTFIATQLAQVGDDLDHAG